MLVYKAEKGQMVREAAKSAAQSQPPCDFFIHNGVLYTVEVEHREPIYSWTKRADIVGLDGLRLESTPWDELPAAAPSRAERRSCITQETPEQKMERLRATKACCGCGGAGFHGPYCRMKD